jgi:hypothetical protein
MMTLTLNCRGTTIDEVIEALDEVTRLLREGHLSGMGDIPGTGPRKQLSLNCCGETTEDLLAVLYEVRRLVCQGITTGFDRRGPGRFHFQVREIASARRLG